MEVRRVCVCVFDVESSAWRPKSQASHLAPSCRQAIFAGFGVSHPPCSLGLRRSSIAETLFLVGETLRDWEIFILIFFNHNLKMDFHVTYVSTVDRSSHQLTVWYTLLWEWIDFTIWIFFPWIPWFFFSSSLVGANWDQYLVSRQEILPSRESGKQKWLGEETSE